MTNRDLKRSDITGFGEPNRAAAVILAAGDSARMGSIKALLDWQGRTLIDHILDTARVGGCGRLYVVLGRDADAIRAGAELAGATVLVNPDPDRGQLSSLKTGLAALDLSIDCALCWPVDVPLVRPDDVRALLSAYAQWRAALMRIFLPVHKGERGHPMLVDQAFRPDFLSLPDRATARTLIEDRHDQVKEVETQNPGVLIDIDTPDDYRRALSDA